jgi:hypothetical protein
MIKYRQNTVATARVSVALIVAVMLVSVLSHSIAGAAPSWYQARLETGETDEYKWSVGAKGPKNAPLNEICALASLLEPPRDEDSFVEGRDSVGCGSLSTREDSVAVSPAFGSGQSRLVLLAVLYRPAVRKVVFVLGSGERRVFRPRMATVTNQRARGIPNFRYLVAPFKGETCIRKVTLIDGKEAVIDREPRPDCRDGGNL